jgi:hypothetical protein
VRVFLQGLALKLVSLGLAMLLWFVIAGEKSSEMGLTVPLELQNFPRELELTGDPVNQVEVRLRASPGIIQRLSPSDVSALVDVADVVEGERILHLTPESIRVPFGVKVVKISPSTLTLNFDRTVLKTVPIHPRLLGRPAPGFEVAEILADPAEVRIVGPRTRVQDLEAAITEPVSVEGARGLVTVEVNLGLEDPMVRIQGSPRVQVTAMISEIRERRQFDAVPVLVRGGPGTVRPGSVRLTVEGPASLMKRLTPDALRAWVDPGGAPKAPLTVVGEVVPGWPGVAVVAIDPPRAEFRPHP